MILLARSEAGVENVEKFFLGGQKLEIKAEMLVYVVMMGFVVLEEFSLLVFYDVWLPLLVKCRTASRSFGPSGNAGGRGKWMHIAVGTVAPCFLYSDWSCFRLRTYSTGNITFMTECIDEEI